MPAKFYLRIPVPGGHEYVKVDKGRLTPDVLLQLYQKEPSRGGPTKYYPVSGNPGMSRTTADLSPLNAVLGEVFPTYQASLDKIGPTGKAAIADFLISADMSQIFDMISCGQIQSAARAWEGNLHSLFACMLQLASELQKKEEHVSGVTAGFEQISGSFDASDVARLKIFDAVIKGSKLLIGAANELDDVELELGEIDQTVDDSINDWNERLSADAEPFKSAREFFERPSEGLGFNLHVFKSRRDPSAFKGNPPYVKKAEEHLKACKEVVAAVQAEWDKLKSLTGKVNEHKQMADLLCEDLSKGSLAINDFRDLFGAMNALPFEHEVIKGKISEAEFKKAEGLTKDRRFGPATAKSRMNNLATRIIARIHDAPKPRDAVVRMMDLAARHIEDAKAALEPKDPPSGPRREAVVLPSDSGSSHRRTSTTPGTINPRRTAELYEFVKCVGLAITNNPHHFAGSTVRSMLDVICHLGLTDPDEAYLYREPVKDISNREGESVRVKNSGRVSKVRKSSKAIWVVYTIVKRKGPNLVFMKVTTSGASRIEPLLDRHSLTIESIKEAYTKSREEKEERRKAKKASGTTKISPP
jgi:hypothetical protein